MEKMIFKQSPGTTALLFAFDMPEGDSRHSGCRLGRYAYAVRSCIYMPEGDSRPTGAGVSRHDAPGRIIGL